MFSTDLWRVGIAQTPIARLFDADFAHQPPPVTWLESPAPFTFYADPFGIWHQDRLYVFVEAYDYRDKHGSIEVHTYDKNLNWLWREEALRRDFHLSYPYVWAEDGEVYMLPEAHRSGYLTLYRARAFPLGWEPVCDLLDLPAIDASLTSWEGRYWLFFALPDDPLAALHLAFADRLTGPWQLHPMNPVLRDITRARMGGTPFIREGALYLPTQNGTHTYGGGMTLNKIETLSPTEFVSHPVAALEAPGWAAPFTQGIHTVSACDALTLFDVKRISHSPARALINLERRVTRLFSAR
jgi:hypothetical protein